MLPLLRKHTYPQSPLQPKERCVTTLITTAKETNVPPRIIHRSVVTETFEEYMLLKSKRTKFSNIQKISHDQQHWLLKKHTLLKPRYIHLEAAIEWFSARNLSLNKNVEPAPDVPKLGKGIQLSIFKREIRKMKNGKNLFPISNPITQSLFCSYFSFFPFHARFLRTSSTS